MINSAGCEESSKTKVKLMYTTSNRTTCMTFPFRNVLHRSCYMYNSLASQSKWYVTECYWPSDTRYRPCCRWQRTGTYPVCEPQRPIGNYLAMSPACWTNSARWHRKPEYNRLHHDRNQRSDCEIARNPPYPRSKQENLIPVGSISSTDTNAQWLPKNAMLQSCLQILACGCREKFYF
jgi:hypothetical protein